MANYLSLELTPPVFPVSGVGLGGRTTHHGRAQLTINTALAAGDTIQLMDLPRNCRVTGGFVKGGSADSGTGVTLNIGTIFTPTLFWSGTTALQGAGSVDRNMAASGTDLFLTAKTRVLATVATAPTTPVTGNTFSVLINFTVEEPA